MRRAAAVDANQAEIVATLRKARATVQPLHTLGMGCPDLLVGHAGDMMLMEVKDGSKPPSARGLTDAQIRWHCAWRGGAVHVVDNVCQALSLIGVAA